MRRYWAIAAGLLITLTLGAFAAFQLLPREPASEGGSLSYWFDQLALPPRTGAAPRSVTDHERERQDAEKVLHAQKAIRSMGAKAVPFLLDKVRGKHSVGERFYGAAWPRIPLGLRQRLPPPRQFRSYGNPHSEVVTALQLLDSGAVTALIPALKDGNSDVQITALAALGGFGANAAVAMPSLTHLARHSNGFVRRWAILTIGRVGPTRTNALDTLVRALNDNDTSPLAGSPARVRETAAEVLGQIGPPAQSASSELRKLLTDADSGVRQEAAIALWRIAGERSVLPILVEELKKRENAKKLIEVLGDMGPIAKPAVPAIKDALGPSWMRAIRLPQLPPPSGHPAGPNATLEEVAGEALRKIDPEMNGEVSNTTLLHVSPLTVNGGESGYAMLGGNSSSWAALDRNAVPALVQVLADPNPDTRMDALLTLDRIGWKPDRHWVSTLTRLLRDRTAFRYRGREDNELGREFVCIGDLAAEMLGQMGADAQPALPSLTELLADPDWNTRPHVPLAVWRISRDTHVLQYLIPNLQSPGTVREYRRFLAVATEMGEAAAPAIPAIRRGMKHFAEDLTVPVGEALRQIDPEAAAPAQEASPPKEPPKEPDVPEPLFDTSLDLLR